MEAALRVDDFDYELPDELVARVPAPERDGARLFAHWVEAETSEHALVRDLPRLLAPGDLLVLNDTRVLPARLFGKRASGGKLELLLVERLPGAGERWRALVRPAAAPSAGERVELEGGALVARMRAREGDEGGRPGPIWLLELAALDGGAVGEWLERVGRMPLPPYLGRPRGGHDELAELDRERYQTVFASRPGAVAAPTAGLHFTPQLLAALAAAGVEHATLTLHVGPGTFLPVRVERVEDHRMHAEAFELPEATALAVARCRARGGRVIAVGTTSARVLETCADGAGGVRAGRGTTDIFLHPGRRTSVLDALLTNFHLPQSTLLMLVAALVGTERVLALYREAIARRYRFYSYGDALLVVLRGEPPARG